MCTNFKIDSNEVQSLINDFFSDFGFSVKKYIYRGTGLISEKKQRKLCTLNLTKELKQPPSSYSPTGNFLQHIYSVLVVKNHQEIQFRCLVSEFSFIDVF